MRMDASEHRGEETGGLARDRAGVLLNLAADSPLHPPNRANRANR